MKTVNGLLILTIGFLAIFASFPALSITSVTPNCLVSETDTTRAGNPITAIMPFGNSGAVLYGDSAGNISSVLSAGGNDPVPLAAMGTKINYILPSDFADFTFLTAGKIYAYTATDTAFSTDTDLSTDPSLRIDITGNIAGSVQGICYNGNGGLYAVSMELPETLHTYMLTDKTGFTWTEVNEADYGNPITAMTYGQIRGVMCSELMYKVVPHLFSVYAPNQGSDMNNPTNEYYWWIDMVLPKNAQGGSLDETAIVDIVSTKNDATYVITSGGTAGKINTLTKATALPNVNKATCLSYDSKLGEIFIGSSNNTIYSVADDVQVGAISLTDNVPAADIQLPASDFPMTKMFAANGIIAYGTSGGGVYVISAESYDNSGTNYVWTENNSFVSVSFKSPGLASGSPKAYTSYVYNVNISGIPLTSNQMFLQGYNGFWYELSNDNGQYKTTVFPVSGLRYAENPQTLTATLTPNPTTVQWAGPICSSFGQDHITVTQCTFDFINNKRVVISKSVIDLIPINDNFITNINKIATATGSSSNSNNIPVSDSGVCGVPLQVTLMSGVTNIDKNDPAYDRLTFYYTQSSGVNDGTLIGSDSLVTILPSSFATIDNNAIKYGKFKTTSSVVGRVYYIYSNLPKGTAFTVNVHLAPSSASGTMITQGLAFNTCSATLTAAQVSVPSSLSGNIAVSYYPNEDASSGIQITNLSNWANPKYPGYIDYLFCNGTDSSSNTQYSFVAGLMPEGLNTRTLDERMKMGALGDYGNSFVGYYLKPLSVSAGSGDSNPIGSTSYSMVATTSNCHAMLNQNLYAYIFDEYGARYEFTVTDSNTVAGKDKDGNPLIWSACDSTTKTAGVRMELASLYPLPLVLASNTKLPSVGVTTSGIYMPPGTCSSNGLGSYCQGTNNTNDGKNIAGGYTYLPYLFLSDIPICIDGTSNDGTYGLNIYSVSSVSPVASSSVKIQEINMDNYNLTVQNSNLTPATNFPSVTRITNFKQIDADFRWRAWGTFVFGTLTQEGMLANQFPIVNDDETIIWYYYPVGGNSKRVAWQCIKNFDGQISVNEASVTTSIFTKSASTNTYITAGAPDDIAADFYIDKSDSGSGVFTDK